MTIPYGVVVLLIVMAVPIAGAIERALSRACVSKKALAYAMRISPTQLSRALIGEQHFPMDRLDTTPILFRQYLLEELFALWNCERPLTARDVLDLIRPVMARASHAIAQKEETA